ncbi:MAG TPA: transketolase C-terminal domain-containing protein [Ignavibacteriaceae bacterium]|nr:transketolase C-terminal domain-containing protein [Ignavibacteriaceae bacterium]
MTSERQIKLRNGNQMIAEGAIHAGCKFFAGYPITPASGIYKGMIDYLPAVGGTAISSPDEISAIAYCVGASMRGLKSMTATSGPGWALMIETFQYALITETPLVISIVQRLGPCTGGATQGAQGDILLTAFATSGGYTFPVIYPTTPRECFELTVKAFSWAEKYRTPVILLSDKEIGMTTESVDYQGLEALKSDSREYISVDDSDYQSWKMYGFNSSDEISKFAAVGGPIKVTATGSAHNYSGELKKNDTETLAVLRHIEDKIQLHKNEMVLVNHDEEVGASTLIISFGITARTAKQAVKELRAAGEKVNHLIIYCLFPIPEDVILEAAKGKSRIIIPEENLNGQYRSVINHLFKTQKVIGVNKIGAMITPSEIKDAYYGEDR